MTICSKRLKGEPNNVEILPITKGSEVVTPEELSWQLLNDRDLVTLDDPRTDFPLI